MAEDMIVTDPSATEPVSETTGSSTDQATVTAAGWTDGLEEPVQAFVSAKGWRDAGAMVESYRHLERKLGERAGIQVPAPDADEAAWNGFYRAAGQPESPAGYEFSMPEGLPEDFAYSSEMADLMRGWAHDAGLNARQAQKLHDAYVGHIGQWTRSYKSDQERRRTAAESELKAEWGGAYKRNAELAGRAIDAFGGAPLKDALKAMGLKGDPRLMRAFARAGELIAEDGMIGDGGDKVAGKLGARAEIERLSADTDFLNRLTDRDKPGHADAVRRWSDLHARAFDGE
tara:strand:+ start:142 stop:1002 length:861 start_codon:yes stop_codon:yes gene_type:complete